jgi:acetylornithine deacetylase
LRGDVLLACVADEENASAGTEEVLESFTADPAIVTEPSRLQVVLAHKGFAWFDVIVHGRAAHGSQPGLGIDAIAKAGHFLVAVEELGRRLAAAEGHPLLVHRDRASLRHPRRRGALDLSRYPARCRIALERRTEPREDADTVQAELTAALDQLAATVPDFTYELRRGLHREPFEGDPDQPVVHTLLRHARSVLGHPPAVLAEP